MVRAVIETDEAQLARWRVPMHSPGVELVRAFMRHPLFPTAGRQLSRKVVDLAVRDPAYDGIAKDLGRYTTTCIAIYLDATGGITLSRLKEQCARMNIASPGRARAILLYLRFLRYVTPVAGDERPATYAATEPLREVWRHMLREALDAARIVEPCVASIVPRLDEAQYMRELLGAYCDGMIYAASLGLQETAFSRVFLSRNAGMQMLHHLMLLAPEDDEYPPRRIALGSLTELARVLRVSRPHLARLLRAAEHEGLLHRVEGGLEFSEVARGEIAFVIAMRLTSILFCAAHVEGEWKDRLSSMRAVDARAGRDGTLSLSPD
jgi:hypothetical protein